jgi:hypothetical protein
MFSIISGVILPFLRRKSNTTSSHFLRNLSGGIVSMAINLPDSKKTPQPTSAWT